MKRRSSIIVTMFSLLMMMSALVSRAEEDQGILLAKKETTSKKVKPKKANLSPSKRVPPSRRTPRRPVKPVQETRSNPRKESVPEPQLQPQRTMTPQSEYGTDSREAVLAFEEIRRLYRAEKMTEVVERAQVVLRQLRTRTRIVRLQIVQGLAYYKLGLRVQALSMFLAAVKSDPKKEELKSAMTNAVAAARELGAEEELLSEFSQRSPDELSRQARESFYYQMGKGYLRQDQPDKALGYLGRVPATSERYIDAKFLSGVAWNKKGDRGRAYLEFRDILQRGIQSQEDQTVWELANLNAARVAFAQKDYLRSVDHYRRVPRSSQFWLDALFESSWPLLHLDQFNWALGNLKTLHSPYFMDKFYPESIILRAILLFRLCKYGEMKRTIKFFRKEYATYQKLMTDYVRGKQEKPLAFTKDVLAYLSEDEGDPGEIPGRVWDWVISDVYFKELRQRNEFLKQDATKLKTISFSPEIQHGVEQNLKIASGKIQNEMNRFVRNKLVRAVNEMRSLEDQLNIIELEQTLGEKKVIEETTEPQAQAEVEVDIEVAKGYELWPFTGEYWKDELGFFAYSTGDSCQ